MEIDGKFYVYLLLAVAETFVLLWFSFLPSVDFVRTGFTRLGDLEHLMAYTVFGFLLHRVFRYFFSRKESVIFSVVVGSLVGGICEISQHLLPYRVGDAADWGIDTLGSFLGGLVSSKFKPSS
ncbi:MAG: VanZ family protein [Candidatus Aenigmatarchaeota archaeon]|nr:MAG: VanZ family protein [Candidatus Aenigmarchaeota archaeon]